jgi:hypothetical protein
MSVGYSGTPLAKKLGIKEGHRVGILASPPHFPELLEPLPEEVRPVRDPSEAGAFDVVVAFVTSGAELVDRFAMGRSLIHPYGGLWLAWPKQSSPLATELKEGHLREHGLSTGLVDNKVCAIDGDWSGLRFVVRKEHRPPRRQP